MNRTGVIPFRIRIGVTGHRTLNDEASLKACLYAILDAGYLDAFHPEVSQALSDTKSTPIVFSVISPLAEGADRLVARAVMERGGLLEALLPMPREEYEKDFATDESRQEFIRLLGRSHRIEEVTSNACPAEKDYRKQSYRSAGRGIVARCDFLIALWDGKPPRGIGGTAEIVDYAISRKKPVFVVSTSEPGRMKLINGGTLKAVFFDETDIFNKLNINDADQETQIVSAYSKLFPSPEADQVPDQIKFLVRERLITPYCCASRQAKKYQESFNKIGLQGYVFSTLSVLIMAFALVFAKSPFIAIPCSVLELVLLFILFEMIHRAESEEIRPGWLEHRALAERLRIAFYFVACGERPDTNGDRVTIHRGDRTWIDHVYHEIIYSLPKLTVPPSDLLHQNWEFISSGWVQGQIKYHRDKAKKEALRNNYLKKFGKWGFILAITVSCIHLAFSIAGAHDHHVDGLALTIEELLPILAITLPAAGAAFSGYLTNVRTSVTRMCQDIGYP